VTASIVERGRSGDAGKSANEVVPEEYPQRFGALRGLRHGVQPRSDEQRLQRETRVQLPPPQLRPAALPGDEREQRERRHQPPRCALRHEADRGTEVHQRVAGRLRYPGRGAVAVPGSEQRQRTAREQAGIGRQPDADAISRERARGDEGCDHCGYHLELHGERESPDRERADEGINEVGSTRGGGGVTEQGQRGPRQPVGKRRLLEKRRIGELWQRAIALQAHAPGDVGFARLIRRPQPAPEDPDEPQRRERERDQHGRRTRRRRRRRR